MSQAFQIQFKNAHIAQAIKFNRQDHLISALKSLTFPPTGRSSRPVLVLVGGGQWHDSRLFRAIIRLFYSGDLSYPGSPSGVSD